MIGTHTPPLIILQFTQSHFHRSQQTSKGILMPQTQPTSKGKINTDTTIAILLAELCATFTVGLDPFSPLCRATLFAREIRTLIFVEDKAAMHNTASLMLTQLWPVMLHLVRCPISEIATWRVTSTILSTPTTSAATTTKTPSAQRIPTWPQRLSQQAIIISGMPNDLLQFINNILYYYSLNLSKHYMNASQD